MSELERLARGVISTWGVFVKAPGPDQRRWHSEAVNALANHFAWEASLAKIQAGAKWNPGFNEKPIPPRLPALAEFIEETWPSLRVTLKPYTTSTDRKLSGSRLRWPGKGRKGRMLTVADPVKDPDGLSLKGVLFTHESGETYRHNGEVCEWIVNRLKTNPKETSSLSASGKAGVQS